MTISYNPDVPNPPNSPSVDVPLMKINTNAISSIIGIDHQTFNFPNTNSGYHKVIHFTNQGSDPAQIVGTGQLYTKGSDQVLWYENGNGNVAQLTGGFNPSNSAQGFTFLPGNLKMTWGSGNTGSGSNTTVSFPAGGTFSSAPYSVVVSLASNAARYGVGNTTTTDFILKKDISGAIGYLYIAIGPA